ncbi:phosphopantetheine-binding protein [Natronospora cellulosivora (SeqCode)]
MERKEIFEKTKELIVDYLRVEESEVMLDTNIVDDLCADSIALVELGFRFSETFSVPMVEAREELFVMNNLVDFLYDEVNK